MSPTLTAGRFDRDAGGTSLTSTPVVTSERYAQGMTWNEYLDYTATPENLARTGSFWDMPAKRIDRSGQMREWYNSLALTEHQEEALRWLAAMPGGPSKMLVLSEEWSTDCRRDVPMAALVAAKLGFELRIFCRDGYEFERGPEPVASPNADLMRQFLNQKDGGVFQSIPVIAYYTIDMEYLCHYTEYPAMYEKERLIGGHIRASRPGETYEETRARGDREYGELQISPFFHIWASAGLDEQISALHRRLVLGSA